MSEGRLVEIEIKLAHQEQTILELNAALANQQASIMNLERRCRALADRIRGLTDALPGSPGGDERPPHY